MGHARSCVSLSVAALVSVAACVAGGDDDCGLTQAAPGVHVELPWSEADWTDAEFELDLYEDGEHLRSARVVCHPDAAPEWCLDPTSVEIVWPSDVFESDRQALWWLPSSLPLQKKRAYELDLAVRFAGVETQRFRVPCASNGPMVARFGEP